MDLFEEKRVSPMLISQMQEPFNDDKWIYELKLDGCRCIGYFDQNGTCLRNKRNMELLPKFPELKELHRNVSERTVLEVNWWCFGMASLTFLNFSGAPC